MLGSFSLITFEIFAAAIANSSYAVTKIVGGKRSAPSAAATSRPVQPGICTSSNMICGTEGARLHADLVVMAVGIRPAVALAKGAGLEVERGILVDDHMVTSDPAINVGLRLGAAMGAAARQGRDRAAPARH